MLKWLNKSALLTATMIVIPLISRAQDVDLSGFEDTGGSVLSQLRDSTLPKLAVTIILAVLGYFAIFTSRINWGWAGVSIVGLFLIFGGEDLVDTFIGFFT